MTSTRKQSKKERLKTKRKKSLLHKVMGSRVFRAGASILGIFALHKALQATKMDKEVMRKLNEIYPTFFKMYITATLKRVQNDIAQGVSDQQMEQCCTRIADLITFLPLSLEDPPFSNSSSSNDVIIKEIVNNMMDGPNKNDIDVIHEPVTNSGVVENHYIVRIGGETFGIFKCKQS